MNFIKHIFAISLLVATASLASAQSKITSITYEASQNGCIVRVTGENLKSPKPFKAYKGKFCVYDFSAVLKTKPLRIHVARGGVDFIKAAQFKTKPPIARVVVSVQSEQTPSISTIPNGYQIIVNAISQGRGNAVVAPVVQIVEEKNFQASAIQDAIAMKQAEAALTNNSKGNKQSQGKQSHGKNLAKPISVSRSQSVSKSTRKNIPTTEGHAPQINTPIVEKGIKGLIVQKPDCVASPTQPKTIQNVQQTQGNKNSIAKSTITTQRITASDASKGANKSPRKSTRITLDFYDTEIVFILKALAVQTASNIVTAPNVQGRMSISLRDVDLEQALDLTTKLSGYRYAKIANTYVVGTPDFLMRLLVHEKGVTGISTTTRVIPLASRKAGEIKRAVIKALGLDAVNETLRIVHPMEQGEPEDGGASAQKGASTSPTSLLGGGSVLDVNGGAGGAPPQDPNAQPSGNGNQGQQGGAQGATPKPSANALEGDADYLILIGDRGRVEQAATMITELDTALAEMSGISMNGEVDLKPVTMTYLVRGGKAEDMANAISAIAGSVRVVATPKSSRAEQSIVLSGRAADVNRLIETLEKLDSVTTGGQLVYEVYEVKYADPRALRDRLLMTFEALNVVVGPEDVSGLSYAPPGQKAEGTGGATAGDTTSTKTISGVGTTGTPVFDDREPAAVPMKLILSGPRALVDEAFKVLHTLDVPAKQVAIEARVADMSREDIVKAGIDWNLISGGTVKLIRLNNSQPAGSDGSPFNEIQVGAKSGSTTLDITATLDKFLSKGNLISRPNLLVTDGREGVVFIGDVVRYIKSITSGTTGPSVEIGEEEVGVKLNVLPRVGADNTISLEVQPTVSFIKSFVPTGNGGEVPITSVRTTRTVLRVMNGETIAIGGLITDEDRKEVSGVPVLMDIPIIGQLFRRTTNTKRRSEIVIFITVRVIEGPAHANNNPLQNNNSQAPVNGNGKGK
ncbi:MAG TPA: hypothetical protein VNK96_06010 [Fimbriimonadales bacterium]|nr:hypothetical protein [Fimbriimonadales bacterium]